MFELIFNYLTNPDSTEWNRKHRVSDFSNGQVLHKPKIYSDKYWSQSLLFFKFTEQLLNEPKIHQVK